MPDNAAAETHHGVLLNILGQGVFITGEPGIGKSSLALECLYQGHQLIADDIAEFTVATDQTIHGQCPTLLADLLHTKELGLIPVTAHFGQQAWQRQTRLDLVIRLRNNPDTLLEDLRPRLSETVICQQAIPTLTLSTHNPASLANRIQTWLKLQATGQQTVRQFKIKQQQSMIEQ